jgi:molybdopterin/thiamine biosynthesis adenylyltransferase
MTLAPDRLDRFARHIVLPDVGGAGQAKLVRSHVVLVGLGGSARPRCNTWRARGSGGSR